MKAALIVFAMLLPGAACAQAQTPAGPQAQSPAGPQAQSPAGLWTTYSDRSGKADGLVRITEESGELQGIVEAVFSPPAPSAHPLCEECPGDLKNQPIVGMKILRGLRWDGGQYSGGEILDPEEGRFYRCSVRIADGGQKLELRGYVGIPLFGRTQIWTRRE
jgi:uncharacterized protein (DUF2147 family)